MTASITSTTILKTDLDMLTKKSSPTNVQSSFNFTKNHTTDNNNQSSTSSSDLMQSNEIHKNNLYGLGITDDDKNGKTNLNTMTNETKTPTIQKRSIIDLGNASSLCNESKKYSDESAGREHLGTINKDALNLTEFEKAEKKSGSITTPTSPSSYQPIISSSSSITSSTSTTINSHSNERRPSWRLKPDSGCKV